MIIPIKCTRCAGVGMIPLPEGQLEECERCAGEGIIKIEGIGVSQDKVYRIIKEIKELRERTTDDKRRRMLKARANTLEYLLKEDGLDKLFDRVNEWKAKAENMEDENGLSNM